MNVTIDSNFREFERALKDVPRKIVIPAAVTAINRAGRDGKRAATKAAVNATGIRRAVFAGSKRTGERARVTGATGNARANRKKLNLVVYARTEKGVPYSKAFGKQSLKRISNLNRKAFIAKMPQSGKMSWFERTGQSKRPTTKGAYAGRKIQRGPRKGASIRREPIRELKVPIHPIGTNAIKKGFSKKAAEVLPVEFSRVINRKLAKLGGF